MTLTKKSKKPLSSLFSNLFIALFCVAGFTGSIFSRAAYASDHVHGHSSGGHNTRATRDTHATHGHGHSQSASESRPVAGVVKKIDKSAGKVTVSHEALPDLGMPAMTMVFRVKDAGWLDKMKTGEKIRFVAESTGGALTIVHLETSDESK